MRTIVFPGLLRTRLSVPFVLRKTRLSQRDLNPSRRWLHATPRMGVVKPFLLADIGEGIREVQIIQWFVREGARVEQFQALCEVQSDKATVEITSRFDGIIKKLHYEADDMALVGKPLVDIDIQSEISKENEALVDEAAEREEPSEPQETSSAKPESRNTTVSQKPPSPTGGSAETSTKKPKLATPAVRHLSKQLNIDISHISGSGKDGRVLKEDVQNYGSSVKQPTVASSSPSDPTAQDRTVPLTPVQMQMYKTMTRSLSIPHFLYTDSVDLTNLTNLRRSLNSQPMPSPAPPSNSGPAGTPKLSALPFIIKAVSLSLTQYPLLNATLSPPEHPSKPPGLTYHTNHNVGVAIDTPQGLLVPVIQHVQCLSILAISQRIAHLTALARSNKISPQDLSGATFTVSNVGSIGGGVVSPVVLEGQVGILGVGRARVVPAFRGAGEVVRREECALSWSADHRVVDGASVARCAEGVRGWLEEPGRMTVAMT